MQALFIISLFLFALSACSPTEKNKSNVFIINGNMTNLATDSVYLENTQTNEMIAAKVSDDKFQFTGSTEYPESFMLYVNSTKDKMVRIFVENSEISITGSADSLGKLKIAGSKSYDEFDAYRKSIQPLRDKLNAIDQQVSEAMEKNLMDRADSLTEVYNQLALERLRSVLDYAKANSHSPIIPFITSAAAIDAPNAKVIEEIFAACDSSVTKNPRIADIREMIASINKVAVGAMVPEFELISSDGRKINRNSLSGKVVLFDFWASWCVPCRKNHPDLVKLNEQYKGRQFEIISISIDKEKENWNKAIKQDGLTWTQVCDFQAVKGKAAKDFGIEIIPAGFLIGADGKVEAKDLHGRKLREKIDQLLTTSKL